MTFRMMVTEVFKIDIPLRQFITLLLNLADPNIFQLFLFSPNAGKILAALKQTT